MKVLYVSFSKRGIDCYADASVRYRCIYPAEYLTAMGVESSVIHISQAQNLDLTDYSHLICHRPLYGRALMRLVNRASSDGLNLSADIDDYLFSPNIQSSSPAMLSGKSSEKAVLKSAKSYLAALSLFEHIVCSTEELAIRTEQVFPNKRVSTCFNKLPSRAIPSYASIECDSRFESKIIRYLPGTSHHQHDYELIKPWIESMLAKHPSLHFQVVGDIIPGQLKCRDGQQSSHPPVPFEQLPEITANSWITIAPLVNNHFNACKSGLKAWESGLLHVPVISSFLPDMIRFNCRGLCLSNSYSEWTDFLERMLRFEEYQQASNEIYKASSNSIFGKRPDERISVLGLTSNGTQSDSSGEFGWLKSRVLSAQFGYSWPLIRLNPLHSQYGQVRDVYNQLWGDAEAEKSANMLPQWATLTTLERRKLLDRLKEQADAKSTVELP
ncbi:MAG: hypothetical protein LPH21_10880, partial [Shewanella sp.]|nr:hypothetical protein [Shewanella sp.]